MLHGNFGAVAVLRRRQCLGPVVGFDLDDLRYAIGAGTSVSDAGRPDPLRLGYQLNPDSGSARQRQLRRRGAIACISASGRRFERVQRFQGSRFQGSAMSIVRRVTHVLILVLTLLVGADGGGGHRVADRLVQELAARLHRAGGAAVSERHAVDRAPRRESVLRHRDGERRRVDGRQPGRRGARISASTTTSSSCSRKACRSTTSASTSLSMYLRREGDTWSLSRLVKKQETEADRSGPEKPIAIDTIGITDGSIVVESPVGDDGRRGAEAVRSSRREALVQVRAGAVFDRDHPCVVPWIRAGARAQRPVRRHRGEGRHAVRARSLRCARRRRRCPSTAPIQNYLTRPVFSLSISSDKLSVPGNRADRAGVVWHRPSAVVQRQD